MPRLQAYAGRRSRMKGGSSQMREIRVDRSAVRGRYDRFANRCAGTGRAGLLLRRGMQEHIAMAVRECGFRYLRFHGLLQDDMGVYREDSDGSPIYSWQYVDEVYDFLMAIGVRPFVVFDFMPQALASGDKTVFWERANVTPPKDYKKWGGLIRAVTAHFTERYGREEVGQWLFEVWNEPDHPPFFTGSRDDYFRLYETTARAVKGVCPDYRVGGPALAMHTEWIGALIEYCRGRNVPLDFITAHSYSTAGAPTVSVRPEDGPGKQPPLPAWQPGPSWPLGHVAYDPHGIENSVQLALREVRESARPDLPVYFTEWGLTWDYWDPLRDSYQAPSFILSRIRSVRGIRCLSYCEISDVFEEDGPATRNFHGGFGLVNLQGIRKPAYFAYCFLNRLGEWNLDCRDPDAIACCTGKNVQVLFWNSAVRQDCENKRYYCRDIPPLPAGKAKVTIDGLAPGGYRLAVWGVGYRRSDAYTLYLGMEEPAGSLAPAQVAWLKQAAAGVPLRQDEIAVGPSGRFQIELDIRENDVYFLTLEAF